MKRDRALVAFLAIFLILVVNPSMSSIPADIVDEAQEAMFSTAADGDESSDGIELFAETSADDTMQYPDACTVDSTAFTSGKEHRDSFIDNSYINGEHEVDLTFDGDLMRINATSPNGYIICVFTGEDGVDLEAATYNIAVYVHNVSSAGVRWQLWIVLSNGSVYVPFAYNNNTGLSSVESTIDVGFDDYYIYVDDANEHVTFDYVIFTQNPQIDVPDSTHYLEDFADVSDWTTSDCSISTDGDLATITENGAGSTGRAYASFSSTDFFEYYYEFRIESMTATTANLEFWDGAAYNTLETFTAAGTYKGIISDADAATMQRIGFLVGSEGGNVKPDYLRVGKSTEMGFSHDGSTTAGTEEEGRSGWSYSISSDGDLLTIVYSRSGGTSSYGSVYLNFDTTATEADIETDYYPMMALTWQCTALSGNLVYAWPYIDGKTAASSAEYFGEQQFSSTFTERTDRLNTKALGGSTSTIGVRFVLTGDDTEGGTIKIDLCKAYSIANFSVDFNTGSKTTDVLYVDANNDLVFDRTSAVYCRINIDPALSVATATHNVWNLTVSNVQTTAGSYDWIFEEYVSGWTGTDDADETRGTLTSGTMTDFRLWSIESFTLSAIKFIEDGTAPDILDKYLDPSIPADDEAVTVTAVAYDAVEVYEVIVNAIVYPTGFSDVDYSMTETAQEHVFTYDFDTLTAGYYLFQITANDGANTYSEYISVRVREAEITISPITFFGVGEDFTQMQMSFDINKDCSYTIYEASASYAEADTHTGSVTEGWSNIAWDKISVVDTSANFSIKFANGSLSTWVNGSYSIAQTTFYVSTVTQMVSLDTVTVTGRITKLGAYQVYDGSDVLQSYGSIEDLDFKVQFTRWGGYDEQNHDFAIKFTNGSQTCWYNSSFYAFKKPVVAPFPIEDNNALYAFQVSFWTLIAVVAIGGMVAVDFYRKEVK